MPKYRETMPYFLSYRIGLAAAVLQGIVEFRMSMTTHQPDESHENAYDWGRDLAHRLTLRHWDE